jgi:hypothetical protein
LSENNGDFTKNEGENRRKLRDRGEEVATSSQECSALFATRYLCFAKCRKQKEGWSKKKVQFFSIFYHFGVISSHIYIGTLLNESLRGAALERRRPRPILTLVGWLVIP